MVNLGKVTTFPLAVFQKEFPDSFEFKNKWNILNAKDKPSLPSWGNSSLPEQLQDQSHISYCKCTF